MALPQRKSIRLSHYDYSQNGVYFVTICTHHKQCTLGTIRRDNPCGCPSLTESDLGRIANQHFAYIQQRYPIKIHKHIVMPNHVHAMIELCNPNGDGQPQGLSLQQVVGGYFKICYYIHNNQ